MHNSALIAACLQVGAVGLGYWYGESFPARSPSSYLACASLAGLIMLVALVASVLGVPVEGANYRTPICITSLLYSAGVVFCEPFFRVKSADEIAVAVVIIVPLIVAIGYLVHAQAWVAAAGVTLFVFICNVMIASNANSSVHGSGFFNQWIS